MFKKYLKWNLILIITNLLCIAFNILVGNYWVIPINLIAVISLTIVTIGNYSYDKKEVKPDEKLTWPPVERK